MIRTPMAEEFCAQCLQESSDESSGSIQEGLFGHEFKGLERRCDQCGSYVVVLWKVFAGFPMKPVGCYRYKLVGATMGATQFLARRIPDDAALIAKTRRNGIIFMVVVLAGIAAMMIYRRSR